MTQTIFTVCAIIGRRYCGHNYTTILNIEPGVMGDTALELLNRTRIEDMLVESNLKQPKAVIRGSFILLHLGKMYL